MDIKIEDGTEEKRCRVDDHRDEEERDDGATKEKDDEGPFVKTTNALRSVVEERDSMKKWNLDTFSENKTFRMTRNFDASKAEQFLIDFFNSDHVRAHIRVASKRSGMVAVLGKARSVKFRQLRTTVRKMTFFQRLTTEGLIAESGYIRKCPEDIFDGVSASDKLRRMFVDEDFEDYCIFDDDEKDEFIFHILQRLVIGGSMCQWEDTFTPYERLTKQIYRELLSVYRSKSSGEIESASIVLSVSDVEGINLFPTDSEHNFCYVVVDTRKRIATLWYNAFVPYW
eukprot:g1286.t1